MLEFMIKSAVCFNVVLVLFIFCAKRAKKVFFSDLIGAWTVGAILYIVTGYVHNSTGVVGYSLRVSFAVFPVMLLVSTYYFAGVESVKERVYRVLIFGVLYLGINVSGVLLDPADGAVKVADLF